MPASSADVTGNGVTHGKADPHTQRGARLALELLVQGVESREHLARSAYRTPRRIVRGPRRAEDDENAIAPEVVDHAVILVDRGGDRFVVAVQQREHVFGG